MSEAIMDLSTVTTNGQVTIPAEVRRLLGVKPGNKVLFFQRANGDVVIDNASVAAIKKAQAAFAGAAEEIGWKSDDDVVETVMEQRYGRNA
ncbi:MAG: type II toxin-antitoxin system PrlF family antitoxin [Coriobacteriia bacterium]|nr:type II toxin-antitoxin system PrlF family antitoxin [Coriobacteriia bacterium]